MRILYIFLAIILCTNNSFAQKTERYSRAKIYLDNNGHSMHELSALGVAADHGDYKKNTFFITDFSASELKKIRKAGFKVEIIYKDASKHYRDQNKKKGNTNLKTTTTTGCDAGPTLDVPAHFHLGSYAGYFTYTEMLNILDSMQLLYPGLISARTAIDTFHSIEGRPIYWIRISNNPTVDQPAKPQMLYTGLHHAREPGSISSTIYYLWYLLEHYGSDPEITSIIDNTELYFVPCVNPDGYLYNISTNPSGGGLWRKNRRLNSDGTYGVDLNRNYGYNWGYDDIGSSPVTSNDTYRGTAGFSEPETQAMKWFAENHHFKINLNYHTYGQDIIYPWSYIPSLLTVDSTRYSAYGQYLTQYTLYRYGTSDETVGYVTNGDSDDWMYGDTTTKNKVLGMTPETGLAEFGFYTPIANIIPDCQNNLRTNINAATLLLPFAKISTTDEKVITQPNGYLHYTIERIGFPDTATFTVTLTPLDSWLTITGSPQTFTNPTLVQPITDSVNYSIAAGTPNGQLIRYERKMYNGFYYIRDTVQFYYGKYYINTVPSTNTLTDWTSSGWGTCTAFYHSPPASIGSTTTCSNYLDNNDITIQLSHSVDLTHALHAYVYFYSVWSIESSYDYAMVEAAPAGSFAWQPLCGRFTKPGTPYQLHDQPIYDGQQPQWVQEELDLSDYLGQKIDLELELVSDAAVNYPGFYFDDMNIIAVVDSNVSVPPVSTKTRSINIFPNPAHGQMTIAINGYSFNKPVFAGLYDCLGRKVMNLSLTQSSTQIELRGLTTGIYYLKAESGDVQLPVKKVEINE